MILALGKMAGLPVTGTAINPPRNPVEARDEAKGRTLPLAQDHMKLNVLMQDRPRIYR